MTDSMSASTSTEQTICAAVEQLSRLRLESAALLFLEGHWPLRFLAGHLLAVAAPAADLLGYGQVAGWAALLNDADATARLRQSLARAADRRGMP